MKKLLNTFSIYKGLDRSIYILFFARIVNAIGSFVYPFLTMFLTDKLGISTGRAGMYILLSGLSFIPGSFIGGKLSDVIGRKKVMVLGQSLSAAAFIPCAFLGDSLLIPWFIIIADFFIGAAHPANQAMATDLSTPQTRKAAFSFLYLGHNIGFAAGPMIAGFLYKNHIPMIFIGDALTSFLSVMLVIFLVPESKPSKEAIEAGFSLDTEERAQEGSLLKVLIGKPFLLIFVIIVTAFNFVYAQSTFSLPIQLIDILGDRGPLLFGSIMTFNAVVVIFFTTFAIALTKKIAPILNVTISGLLYAVGFGIIFFIESQYLFFVSTFIWTIGEIIGATNTDVYIANHTPISHRGRFNSILPVLLGSGHILGPAVMGKFIEKYSVRDVWSFSFFLAGIGIVSLLLLYFIERKFRKGKEALSS